MDNFQKLRLEDEKTTRRIEREKEERQKIEDQKETQRIENEKKKKNE